MAFAVHLTIGPQEVDPHAEQHAIRTQDGVTLATDVYLPPAPGRLPAVLVRTPYDKASRYTRLRQMARFFVEAGYVPVLHWVEWFDPGLAPLGMTDFWYFHGQPSARHLHYLRAAAGDHSGLRLSDLPLTSQTNPAENDDALAFHVAREAAELIEFFDCHLKGTGELRYRTRWETGNGNWQTSLTWPPATQSTRLYLTSPASLAAAPATGLASIPWTHDPQNPTPSGTTANEMWELLSNFPDDRDLARGDGALSFDTEPLTSDLEIAGTPVAALTVQIDGPSTHLFVRLIDAAPDGTARPITRGRAVVYAESSDVQIRIPLQDTAYRFPAGHRVRLHLSSTDHPYCAVHPGTDENPWTATKRVRREHRVRVGGDTTSWIELATPAS